MKLHKHIGMVNGKRGYWFVLDIIVVVLTISLIGCGGGGDSSGSGLGETGSIPQPSPDLAAVPPPPPPLFSPAQLSASDFSVVGSTPDASPYLSAASTSSANAVPCHQITGASTMPQTQDWAPPYNVLSNTSELMISVDCSGVEGPAVTVGTGDQLQYIYQYGYAWHNNQWETVPLAGSNYVDAGIDRWYVGVANGLLPYTQLELDTDQSIAAWICTWTGSRWKCGCRNPECLTSHWALQVVQKKSCPPLTTPKKNLVLVTHGWLSNKDIWAEDMAAKIRKRINNSDWDVCAYDWRDMANTSTPWVAWENAAVVGQDLAVLPLLHKYDHIHFIAHSAGSRLIEKAAQTIRQTDSSSPTIHSTFLDAFAPSGHTSIYGESADWAEHYFDTRLISAWLLLLGPEVAGEASRLTDVILPHAFNIDVTNSDTFDKHSPHQWPHEWYNWSIEFWVYAFSVEVGFELSLERGLLSSLPSHAPGAGGELFYPRGGICVMSDLTSKLDDCGKVSQGSW